MVLQLDKSKPIRYVRFPSSPEKILEIEGFLNGKAVKRSLWRASNLFSAYRSMTAKAAFQHSFVLNEIPKGSYLAVALNGQHGIEGAYAALRVNGKLVGAPDRSLSYRSNAWEYPVPMVESNYTYYFPLTEDMKGSTIDAVVMVMKDGMALDQVKTEQSLNRKSLKLVSFKKDEIVIPEAGYVLAVTGTG